LYSGCSYHSSVLWSETNRVAITNPVSVPIGPTNYCIEIARALSLSGNQIEDTFEIILYTKQIPKHPTTWPIINQTNPVPELPCNILIQHPARNGIVHAQIANLNPYLSFKEFTNIPSKKNSITKTCKSIVVQIPSRSTYEFTMTAVIGANAVQNMDVMKLFNANKVTITHLQVRKTLPIFRCLDIVYTTNATRST